MIRGIYFYGTALKLVPVLLLAISLFAAEKNRDWQTGQVAPSKSPMDARIQYIAGAGKTYVVRGDDLGIPVGGAVRFAVQGSTMYVSLEGREYKLTILGATVKLNSASPTPPVPPAPPVPAGLPVSAEPPVSSELPVSAEPPSPAAAPAPVRPAAAGLDNDAVVKMIVGGLKEDTVIQVVQSRPGSFNLTPAGLDALRAAGVPQSVIAAMDAKMSSRH